MARSVGATPSSWRPVRRRQMPCAARRRTPAAKPPPPAACQRHARLPAWQPRCAPKPPAARDAAARRPRSRGDSSSSATQKPLISREIFRIRRGSTKVLGICGQGSSCGNFAGHAQQASHLVLPPEARLLRFAAALLLKLGGCGSEVVRRPSPRRRVAELVLRGLRCCSGKDNPAQVLRLSIALLDALLADPFGGPHDPLVGNVQLRFFFQVLAGLLKTTGVTARVNHLAEHDRTDRVIRRDSQDLGVREKKPCGIACNRP